MSTTSTSSWLRYQHDRRRTRTVSCCPTTCAYERIWPHSGVPASRSSPTNSGGAFFAAGVTPDEFHAITVANPARALTPGITSP